MALMRKKIPTFGREDRASGLRVLLRGQSFVIRLVVFLIVAGVFLLVVSLTHKNPSPRSLDDSVVTQQP